MSLIDSHVNLHAAVFAEDCDSIIARARSAGVACMISICDRIENADAVHAIAAANPDIFASLGAHPHYAKDHVWLTAEELLARLGPRTVGIGETGLDLHYGFSPIEDQVSVFRAHIEAARRSGLPLIIHTREADVQTAEILEEEYERGAFPMLLHCYTSGAELARRAYALGAYISFSGILTFKNAHAVRDVALQAPLERVILETDCPYLAPVPFRGRRCEPMMVREVYTAFAGLRALSFAQAEELVWRNFHALFRSIPT